MNVCIIFEAGKWRWPFVCRLIAFEILGKTQSRKMAEMFGRIEFQFALPKLIHLAHLMHEYSQSQNCTYSQPEHTRSATFTVHTRMLLIKFGKGNSRNDYIHLFLLLVALLCGQHCWYCADVADSLAIVLLAGIILVYFAQIFLNYCGNN